MFLVGQRMTGEDMCFMEFLGKWTDGRESEKLRATKVRRLDMALASNYQLVY